MSAKDSPCRLFVYLAQEAPVGVVLRRGPSDWVRLSLWHTDDDTFEHGQWMKCRVYQWRSDLSPDGSLFVYFARGVPRRSDAAGADSWLAISRPPYFTALALWFVGGTYATGGFFPDCQTLWHGFNDDRPDQGRVPDWLCLRPSPPPYVDDTNDWPNRTVFINRLLRDGWERVEVSVVETWQRRSLTGDLTLVMTLLDIDFAAYGGPYLTEYSVRREPEGPMVVLPRVSWADWDQRGRLVVTRDGRLYRWLWPGTLEELEDFNPQIPQPAPAPTSAMAWPQRPARDSGFQLHKDGGPDGRD